MSGGEAAEAREHRRFLLLVLGVGIAALWIAPLGSSFWLDETVTAWVTDTGFTGMLHRALEFQAMSPLYYVIAWTARSIGGAHEIVFRIPSVLAMAAATILLYRLGRRLFDAEAALLAAIVFATSFGGAYAATDARPYAFGLLALIGSTLALVRWLDDGKLRDGIAFVLLAVLVFAFHYLLAAALPAHFVYAFRRRREGVVSAGKLAAAAAGMAILLVPFAPHFLSAFHDRGTLSLGSGNVWGILITVAPPAMLGAIGVGILLSGRRVHVDSRQLRAARPDLLLLALWALAPPVLLMAASGLLGAGVFSGRYLLSALPPLCLLAGAGIRMIGPAQSRRIVATCVVITSLLSIGTLAHTNDTGYVEDWRGAIARVNELVTDPATPVVIRPGLIESRRIDWLTDPERVPYLLAPASLYPIEGHLVPAPFGLDRPDRTYLEGVTERVLLGSDRFIVLARIDGLPILWWLEGRLAPAGFTSNVIGEFGSVDVVEFTKQDLGPEAG